MWVDGVLGPGCMCVVGGVRVLTRSQLLQARRADADFCRLAYQGPLHGSDVLH